MSVGSFLIKNYVLRSFHQGDKRFGETAGIQCACIALTELCWSVMRKVSIWRAADLDYIWESGDWVDKNFQRIGLLLVDYLLSKRSVTMPAST